MGKISIFSFGDEKQRQMSFLFCSSCILSCTDVGSCKGRSTSGNFHLFRHAWRLCSLHGTPSPLLFSCLLLGLDVPYAVSVFLFSLHLMFLLCIQCTFPDVPLPWLLGSAVYEVDPLKPAGTSCAWHWAAPASAHSPPHHQIFDTSTCY